MDHFIHPSTLVRCVYKSQQSVIQQNIPDNTRTFIVLPFLIGVLQPRLNTNTFFNTFPPDLITNCLVCSFRMAYDRELTLYCMTFKLYKIQFLGAMLTLFIIFYFLAKSIHWCLQGLFWGKDNYNNFKRQLCFFLWILMFTNNVIFLSALDYNWLRKWIYLGVR